MTGAVRAAIAAGVVAAGFTLAVVVKRLPPHAVLDLVGVDPAHDIAGGIVVTYAPPPDVDPQVARAQLERWVDEAGGRLDPDGPRPDGIDLAIPGVGEDEVEEVIAALKQAGLEFRLVVSNAEVMQRIYATTRDDPAAARLGVGAEVDGWNPDSGGHRTDYYLHAETLAALRTYVTDHVPGGLSPAPGVEIVFEVVEGLDRPLARTYLVESTAVLDGSAVANVTTSHDLMTNLPVVLLDFTREGGERFAELTRRHTGEKIATMLGGMVRSAPIINGPILGGRVSISMGGSDPAQQEAEAKALVATLRAGPLPSGGQLLDYRVHPRNSKPGALWLARALCAVVVGATAFVLLLVLGRHTRPTARATGAPGRPRPWIPLIVTLSAIVVMAIGQHIAVPGVDRDIYEEIGDVNQARLSIFALGIMPLVLGFAVVELVAALATGRAWRTTPDGRRRLAVATVIVGTGFAAIYALSIADDAAMVNAARYSLESTTFAAGPKALAVVTVAAGTLVLGLVAATVSAHGLGNGFAVVFGAEAVIGMIRHVENNQRAPIDAATAGIYAAVVITTAIITRWLVTHRVVPADPPRDGGERPPPVAIAVAGVTPMVWTSAALVVLGFYNIVASSRSLVIDLMMFMWRAPIVNALIVVLLTLGLGVLLSGPRAPARLVARMTQAAVAPAWRAWWIAAACAALATLGLYLVHLTAAYLLLPSIPGFWVVTVAIATAAVLDVVEDWRARRRADLVAVWPIQQAGMTEAVVQLLARAGITPHLRGRHVRALLHVFGPFAPIEVWVPPDRAAEATAILRDAFDPAARGVASAF